MTEEQFNWITKWQDSTFPQATSITAAKHLQSEVKELIEALYSDTIGEISNEFADCFLLLFGAAHLHGMTYKDICYAIDDKMEMNKKRTWGKPNSDGYVEHVKEDV